MNIPRLRLSSVTTAATTYTFHAVGDFGWAHCTVNDATGELTITSDWGDWQHRWNAHPEALGAPTLTAFIGTRGGVDYLARKLQNEGNAGREFSAEKTAVELRRRLCEVRLGHGREQIANRLEPEDMEDDGTLPACFSFSHDKHGLPLLSYDYVDAPTWNDPNRRERLPYMTRDTARRIWTQIGSVADDCGRGYDLFYERVQQIEGFSDYVTDEPWHYGESEQTTGDKALREIILPALIEACRTRAEGVAADPVATQGVP